MAKDISDAQFQQEVLDASKDKLIMVDFWAEWCGPCRMLAPILDEVVKEMGGKVELVKVNIDEHQENARTFFVKSIPAVFFFKNGENVSHIIGLKPKSELISLINELI